MGHGTDGRDPSGMVDPVRAEHLAGALEAMADPVRVRILTALRDGPGKLGDLAAGLGTTEAELSYELTRLVDAGLVGRGDDDGAYALHDDHVESLLDEAVGHVEHRRLDLDDRVARDL